MNAGEPYNWDERHRGKPPGEAEPFLIEMRGFLPAGGRVLDVAAGRGRNALALARAGFRVVAADRSRVGLEILGGALAGERLPVGRALVDFDHFPFRPESFDAIVNLNFLNRGLFAQFPRTLKSRGVLVVDTFLVDQAELGAARDSRFLLGHYELRELLSEFELLRYREGIVAYPDGMRAWRAGAVARRRD